MPSCASLSRPARWTGLFLVAAALVAGCTSHTSGRPVSGGSPSTAGTTSAATSSATSGSPSATLTTPAAVHTSTGNANWIAGTNFATLPHPDMDCSGAGQGGKVEVLKVVAADVTGDGVPEAIVRMECAHSASEWPDTVDVYSGGTGAPTVIGELLKQGDGSYAPTSSASGKVITLTITKGSSFAPGCCPDLSYTRTFTWNGTGFTAGPLLDVLKACGDTAFAVSAGQSQGATGHSSVVLLFKNHLPQACTIRGYPGVDAVTATGATLAHATRTQTGFAGGAHSVQTLTVGPGQTVSATLEWMNFNPSGGGACPTSSSIQVTPANTADTVQLHVGVTTCVLQIHPTVAGTSGSN